MLLRRIGKMMWLCPRNSTKAFWLEHLWILNLCKLTRPSLHFLQRRRISSGRLWSQLSFNIYSSRLISLPGSSHGLANPSGSYTVAIKDITPLRFSGCSRSLKTKLIVSRSTSQWIPRALSRGKLSDFNLDP